jgi:hypothetical protein
MDLMENSMSRSFVRLLPIISYYYDGEQFCCAGRAYDNMEKPDKRRIGSAGLTASASLTLGCPACAL